MSRVDANQCFLDEGEAAPEIGYSPFDDTISSTQGSLKGKRESFISQFEYISYNEVDQDQRIRFEELLVRETSWKRTFLHKGLAVNVLFFLAMVVSIMLGEVFFPLEGVRGEGAPIVNHTNCLNNTAGCVAVRVIRAASVFGFIGGVTNWIAIEMLFRSIPLVIGTGIIAKSHKVIRQSLVDLVVDTLFDPMGIRQYSMTKKRGLRPMLQLESHFASLMESEAAKQIIESKIDAVLNRPEGFMLSMMGLDLTEFRGSLLRHVRRFIKDISPTIVDKMEASGLSDGVGLQAEIEKILECRVTELSAKKVNQLIAVMIRKHLSWLIVWGNIFGALVGLMVEVVTVAVAYSGL